MANDCALIDISSIISFVAVVRVKHKDTTTTTTTTLLLLLLLVLLPTRKNQYV